MDEDETNPLQPDEAKQLERIEHLACSLVDAIAAAITLAGDDEKRLRRLYDKGLSVNRRVGDATQAVGHQVVRASRASYRRNTAASREAARQEIEAKRRGGNDAVTHD